MSSPLSSLPSEWFAASASQLDQVMCAVCMGIAVVPTHHRTRVDVDFTSVMAELAQACDAMSVVETDVDTTEFPAKNQATKSSIGVVKPPQCSGVFCEACISEWQRKETSCPMCRHGAPSWQRDELTDELIRALPLVCPLACGWTCARYENCTRVFAEHQRVCANIQRPCQEASIGCKFLGNAAALAQHVCLMAEHRRLTDEFRRAAKEGQLVTLEQLVVYGLPQSRLQCDAAELRSSAMRFRLCPIFPVDLRAGESGSLPQLHMSSCQVTQGGVSTIRIGGSGGGGVCKSVVTVALDTSACSTDALWNQLVSSIAEMLLREPLIRARMMAIQRLSNKTPLALMLQCFKCQEPISARSWKVAMLRPQVFIGPDQKYEPCQSVEDHVRLYAHDGCVMDVLCSAPTVVVFGDKLEWTLQWDIEQILVHK